MHTVRRAGEGFFINCSMSRTDHCKEKMSSFASKLDNIEVSSLNCSAYSKRYLQHLLDHRLYYLAIYADVLDTALSRSSKDIRDLNLLDFGAGNGLLGMFASHCGFKKVFLCDVNENFVKASQLTAQIVQVTIAGFVTGDLDKVNQQFPEAGIDVIVATDVIEHIYNLDVFFDNIQQMNPAMVTVFTTASNPANQFKVRQLKKMQLKDEFRGGDPGDFVLAGEEKHAAYLHIRRAIIRDNFPAVKGEELDKLATATRGLRRDDIIAFIRFYTDGHPIQSTIIGNTNTCHPETGSWSERILPIDYYKQLYLRHGFNLAVQNGFYNDLDPGPKQMINYFMNLLVKILGKKTAPFITLIGFPQG